VRCPLSLCIARSSRSCSNYCDFVVVAFTYCFHLPILEATSRRQVTSKTIEPTLGAPGFRNCGLLPIASTIADLQCWHLPVHQLSRPRGIPATSGARHGRIELREPGVVHAHQYRLNGAVPRRPPRSAPLPAARGIGCSARFISVPTAKAYKSNHESTS